MKVHELKEILNNYDDTADVFFFTGYSTIPYYELLNRQEVFNLGICTQGIAMEIEAAERLDTINSLILTPTGEEFKQAKLNLNHWKNYDNLSRAEYFNQSKIKALVAQVEKVKKWYQKKQSTKTAQLYAYSFDRETWQGDFNSREEAMQAAMNDEHNKGCLVVYTGIAKLYTPALKSETVLDILKIEADEIAGIAAADWLKLEDISEEACSELEKTLTAAVMKWLEKHSLKPDFYESISSVQAHGIDDYFKKK
jgi:hypothetical protein